MSNDTHETFFTEDDELIFSAEEGVALEATDQNHWKIMLVDDEKEIHHVTKLALKDFAYEGKGLAFVSAYSAQEARQLIQSHSDTALILLDVVMETDHAGLALAKYIRETLGNNFVRIILRTGQPGQAPEGTVIVDYDINDYKAKTELTTQKLFTTIVTALRSYRDITTLDKIAAAHRQAEEALRESEARNHALIDAIPDLMFRINREGVYLDFRGSTDDELEIPPDDFLGKTLHEVLPIELAQLRMQYIKQALKTGEVQIYEYRYGPRGTTYDYEDRVAVSGQNEVLTIARNITQRKQAEQERLRLSTIERELHIAHNIQQSLLPPPHPDWPNLDVVCYNAPAREVGGDLYTYHAFAPTQSNNSSTDKHAVVIGDVSGKGVPAALLMAITLTSFHSTIGQELPPGDLLAALDKTLLPYTEATQQNCALVYTEIDRDVLRVANAGCITPIVKQSNGSVRWVEAGGMPLGVGLGTEFGYQEVALNVSKGDVIVLTSDGVVEATNAADEMFSFERLEQVVATGSTTSAQAMLDHLCAEIDSFVGDTEPHDDVTIIVVRI